MDEDHKVNKIKKYKDTLAINLFKNLKDEDFFKSSSEDISDTISFKKEIKNSENNIKIINKKNNLILNKKLLNSKFPNSSTNKKKENDDNEKNEKEKEFNNKEIFYEQIEKENSEGSGDIKNIIIENKNNNNSFKEVNSVINNNSKKLNLNISNINSQKSSYKSIISDISSSNNSNKKDKSNKKITKSVDDSSFNGSNSSEKKSNNNSIKNNNDQNIINLRPLNLNKRENLLNYEILNSNRRISTTARTESQILETEKESKKNDKNNEFKRGSLKRNSQRDFSMNTSQSSNNNKEENKNYIKNFIVKRLLNIYILIIMSFFHFFSLFSNDIRHIWLPKKIDIYFDILNFISFLYFIIEIVGLYFLDNTYLFSFFFWVDLIGTICIIFGIEYISNYIFGYNLENGKIDNSTEYIHIGIIILERVIRATKVIRCINLYDLIETIKKFKYIYSQQLKRDLVKEEFHKQKLIQKMHNIEEGYNDEIEESVISNESYRHTRNSSNFYELNDEEEENESIDKNIKRREKKTFTITRNNINDEQKKEQIERLKKLQTSKKVNRGLSRKSFKLMRQNTIHKKNINEGKENLNLFNFDEEEKKEEEEKKLKQQIEEKIKQKIDETIQNTKIANKVKSSMRIKIILFFISLLLICIILNEEILSGYKDKNNLIAHSYLFDCIQNNPYKYSNISNYKIDKFLVSMQKEDFSVINVTRNNNLIYENSNLSNIDYRLCEILNISSNFYNNNTNEIINVLYSVKRENNLKHILYLVLTFISCISILFFSKLIETDLTNILLVPFEVMIEVADKVSKDPMNAKNIDELEQEVISLLQKNEKKEQNIKNKVFNEDINKKYNECYNSYEVKVIMNAIIKISALLAMSVGEAGGEIIHKNLSSTLGLHFHSRGKKKIAIFGFCNIRNFEEINLALEEETIPLINKIAEIVHSSVDKFRGNTNKNIGDSFLNVWKFYNNLNIKNYNDKKIKKDNLLEKDPLNPQVNITADCAVLAYLRCILKINKNRNILSYRNNKKLNKIIPNFKISMGFGLHLGYGIEGPVGSIFKMEASYLSPNVNIAARLETATKQFGVSILISGNLYNLFTEEMKEICRYVDCVTVKGSTEPIDLYTIDINYNVTKQKRGKIKIIKNYEERTKIFKEKRMMIESLIEEYGSISPIILEKKSYMELIDEKEETFLDSWEKAIKFYKNGIWEKAKLYFKECLKEDSNDGPANTLYNYIKKFNFKSPEDWKGKRELTVK